MSKLLSKKEAVILELLIGKQELFGLEMVALSEGLLRRGTIYVTLQRMEKKGYVTSRLRAQQPNEAGTARRLYQRTALGERKHEELRQVNALLAQLRANEIPS